MDKTPRKSPGGKRSSPPGPKIKPKHKEAPHIRGAVGDIRKWLAKTHREGRELGDTGQERSLQKDTNQGPKAPLETRIEDPPGDWSKAKSLRTQESTKVSAPPPLEPSKTSEINRQGRKEAKNTGLNKDKDNIQGKNQEE